MYEFLVPQGQPKPMGFVDEKGRITDKNIPGAKEIGLDKFSIGALKGFQMALVDLDNQGIVLKFRDLVTIECTGSQDSGAGKDDMILFDLTIDR
jgi:hypothetical protein